MFGRRGNSGVLSVADTDAGLWKLTLPYADTKESGSRPIIRLSGRTLFNAPFQKMGAVLDALPFQLRSFI